MGTALNPGPQGPTRSGMPDPRPWAGGLAAVDAAGQLLIHLDRGLRATGVAHDLGRHARHGLAGGMSISTTDPGSDLAAMARW